MTTALPNSQPHSTRVIAVTPDLITLAGDGNAAIFLAQVLFWWKVKGRNKFYKFNSPCDHALYRSGDSWLEEVCLKRTMFATARRRVAVKVRISCPLEIQRAFSAGALVVYGTDENHLTWYIVNEAALQTRSPMLYARLFGTESTPACVPGKRPRATQPAKPAESSPLLKSLAPQPPTLIASSEDSSATPVDISHPLISASAEAGAVQPPMQEVCIGISTKITTQTASENSLQKQIPFADIPLPTPAAGSSKGEGGEVYQSEQRKVAFAIFTDLQERGVQADPARLIVRRALQVGLGVEETLEIVDAHLLDAKRADVRSPVGVVVSRMLNGTQITPAPTWALAKVRRLNQEQAWEAQPVQDGTEVGMGADSGGDAEGTQGEVSVGEQLPVQALWQHVLGDIKLQVTRATYEQRFKGTWLEQRGTAYVVCARDPHTVEWLAHRLNPLVTQTLQRWGGGTIQPHFACG